MRRNGSADGNGTSLVRCVIEEKVGTETLGAISASEILHSSCCFLIFLIKGIEVKLNEPKSPTLPFFFTLLFLCY